MSIDGWRGGSACDDSPDTGPATGFNVATALLFVPGKATASFSGGPDSICAFPAGLYQ